MSAFQMPSDHNNIYPLFVELGAVLIGLAILARIASRWGVSAIPLYLIAGLALDKGGLFPLDLSKGFIQVGAEIGVLLLLFMLGLEYSGEKLASNLKSGFSGGLLDLALNFTPGLALGLLLGWKPLAAVLLGGVTYVSSSGIIAKVLGELRRMDFAETPTVLSVLVLEDLAMAVYLPIVVALLVGGSALRIGISLGVAIVTVTIVLLVSIRFGKQLSRVVAHESDEILMLSMFGMVLLVAGLAQSLQVSAAIGAFLVGIAASGPVAERSHHLISPLRDLFAATFFLFFGLEIDPASLLPSLPLALGLAVVGIATKLLAGYWATGRLGVDRRARLRAGAALIARGEFSIVIAGLGAALEPQLGPLAAAYVLVLAVAGPILARVIK